MDYKNKDNPYGLSPVDLDLIENAYYVGFIPFSQTKNTYMITKKNSTPMIVSLIVAFVLGWVFFLTADNYSAGYSTFAYWGMGICFAYFVIVLGVAFLNSNKRG